MPLSGRKIKLIQKAILDGYRTKDSLQRLVRFSLNESLDTIVIDSNLTAMVFSLIDWCDSQGRLYELIRYAYQDNPENPKIKALVEIVPELFVPRQVDTGNNETTPTFSLLRSQRFITPIGIILVGLLLFLVIQRPKSYRLTSLPTEEPATVLSAASSTTEVSGTPTVSPTTISEQSSPVFTSKFVSTILQIGIIAFENCRQLEQELIAEIAYSEQIEFISLGEEEQLHTYSGQLPLLIRGQCSKTDRLRLTFVWRTKNTPRNIYTLDEFTATTSALDLDRSIQLGRAIVQYSLNDFASAAQNFGQLASSFQDTQVQGALTLLYANSLLFNEEYTAAIDVYTQMNIYESLHVPALNNLGIAAINRAIELGWFQEKGPGGVFQCI